jgi:hypothetical protein
MRLSRWVLLGLLVIGVLVAIEVGIIVGLITPDPIASFLGVIFALTVISILSIIGAVFVGMFVSHRILSTKGFTPFEQEMLRMRQEIRELNERMSEIAVRLGIPLENRKNPP